MAYENGWRYDAAGNRVGETHKSATLASPSTFASVTTTVAEFNSNDWLTSQTRTTQTSGAADTTSQSIWTYDDNGAEKSEAVGTNPARVNGWDFEGHLKTAGTQGQSDGYTRYSTDASGNRVAVTTGVDTTNQKTTSYLVCP